MMHIKKLTIAIYVKKFMMRVKKSILKYVIMIIVQVSIEVPHIQYVV